MPDDYDNPFLHEELEEQSIDPGYEETPDGGVLLKIQIVEYYGNPEGASKTSEAYAVSTLPDVCRINGTPVPFQIKGDFGTTVQEHPSYTLASMPLS